jgi:hypothetical protein
MSAIFCIFEGGCNATILSRLLGEFQGSPDFQRSHAGNTGKTFLPIDYDFNWVVKWQNRLYCQIEFIATEFFRRGFQHLSVPRPLHVTDISSRQVILRQFKQQDISVKDEPLLLEYCQGNTLAVFYVEAHVEKLDSVELAGLFKRFGIISGYDFLIGNNDRLIPSGLPACLSLPHQANGGNVLIELSGNSVAAVHAIDNGPNQIYFFDGTERDDRLEDQDEGVSFAIFDGEGPAAAAPIKAVSLQGDEYRRARASDFLYFMQAQEGEMTLLAMKILEGIQTAWKKALYERQLKSARPLLLNVKKVALLFNPEKEGGRRSSLCNSIKSGLMEARNDIRARRESLQYLIADLRQKYEDVRCVAVFANFVNQNLMFERT